MQIILNSVHYISIFMFFSSVFLSSRRIDFFVVCIAMQMFPNSVQSESILILGKFSPAAEKGEDERKMMTMMAVMMMIMVMATMIYICIYYDEVSVCHENHHFRAERQRPCWL